jgi:PAS domain S-box-containing protein
MNPSWVEFLVEQQDYAAYLLLFCCVVLFTRIGWRHFIRRLNHLKKVVSPLESRWHRMVWPLALVLVPLLGWFATEWGSRRPEIDMRNNLLKRVEMATVSIPLGDLQKLSGTAADLDSPAYKRVVGRLVSLKLAAPDVRNVYIMGSRNSQVFFYADAEPVDSDSYSPPGCIYHESSPEFLAAFKQGRGIIEGPLPDSYGIWVSGSFPLRDPQSGTMLGMLGMDIDATEWDAMIHSYRKVIIGLTFLVSLVVLFLYYMSQWFSVTATRVALSDRRHRELAAMQRAMLNSTDYAIIAVSNDGRIRMFNTGAERMLGYSAADAVGLMTLAHFHVPGEGTTLPGPASAIDLGPAICDFLRHQERAYEHEWTFVRQDHSQLSVLLAISSLCGDDGAISGYLCIANDITDRKQTDELLRVLRSSVQQATESIVVTTAQLDLPGPQIIFANSGFCRMSGYALDEVIGKTPRILQGPRTRRSVLDRLRQALGEGHPFLGETVNYRKDGTPYEVEWRISPVRNHKGVVTHFVSVQNDVSQRHRDEQELLHRDRLLTGVSEAGHHLLAGVTSESIKMALRTLGLAAEVDRVYIFENHDDPVTGEHLMNQRYEWVNADVAPEIDNPNLQGMPYAPIFTRWYETMEKELPVYGLVRDFSPAEQQNLGAQAIVSILVVPIFIDNCFWGSIGFDECHRERIWSQTEIGVLMAFANAIGGAIIRMRAEVELASARRREVTVAAKIQQSLLVTPPKTSLPGVDLAVVSIASQEVDGDFYDFFLHGPHCFDVVVGDVMGKGIPAALLGAATKSAIGRTMADLTLANPLQSRPSPQEIMNKTDSLVTANMVEVDSFATVFYARIETAERRLTWIDMGHTKTLLYRHGQGRSEWLKGNGLPLGIGISRSRNQQITTFEPGDILIIYSDGISETTNAAGEFFGEDRLVTLIRQHAACEAQAILERILDAVSSFAAAGLVYDDRTCIVIKATAADLVASQPGITTMDLSSDLNSLPRVREFIRNFCRGEARPPRPSAMIDRLELASTEIASNLMRHTFRSEPYHRIRLFAEQVGAEIVIRFCHWGEFYEPTSIREPDLDGYPEGGFGLFLVKQSVDTLKFSQDAGGRCCIEIRLCLDKTAAG